MKKFINEFKKFAIQGNFIQMAVGIIIGGAFSSIVQSLVADIFMPIIACITGDVNFSDLCINLKGDITLNYGNFIQALFNFVVIALCMFIVVKVMNTITEGAKKEKEEAKKVESDELLELKKITALLEKK